MAKATQKVYSVETAKAKLFAADTDGCYNKLCPVIRCQSVPQTETLAAGVLFARTEGIIPAPESAHAIAQAIREAKRAKEEGVSKTILFNLSGHGQIDLYAYEQYFAGNSIRN